MCCSCRLELYCNARTRVPLMLHSGLPQEHDPARAATSRSIQGRPLVAGAGGHAEFRNFSRQGRHGGAEPGLGLAFRVQGCPCRPLVFCGIGHEVGQRASGISSRSLACQQRRPDSPRLGVRSGDFLEQRGQVRCPAQLDAAVTGHLREEPNVKVLSRVDPNERTPRAPASGLQWGLVTFLEHVEISSYP